MAEIGGVRAATHICVQTYMAEDPLTIEADMAKVDKRTGRLVFERAGQKVREMSAWSVIAWWAKKG